jgi:hypothetical protein
MEYPILMADILNSRSRNSNEIMSSFRRIVTEINESRHKQIMSPLTITLGDEFQGLISSVENAIGLIFEIEELIIKQDSHLKLRYVLNYGKIDTNINTKTAYEMLGPGLTDARTQLGYLKKDNYRFFISLNKEPRTDYYLNLAFTLYQSIVDAWKPKDLKIVSEFLTHLDYKEVAKKINTDTANAWRREKSLRINEYLATKELILYLASTNEHDDKN